MPIRMLCTNCRQPLTIADHLAGKRINCPKCKNQVAVPMPDGSVPPAPRPAPVPAQAPAHDDDLQLNLPGREHTRHNETEQHKRCPGCGRDLLESAVLCTGCGHDFKTGLRRKGFEMADPDKKKRIFETVLRNGFFVIVLVVAVGGIYYAYKEFTAEKTSGKEEEKKKEETPPPPTPPPTPTPTKTTPTAEVKSSLLVVVNDRFQKVKVFADREKIGEAGYRETSKITLPPTGEGKAVTISFEAELHPSVKLSDAVSAALNKGTPFSGTLKQGLRITLRGPGADMVPQPDEPLPGLLIDLEVKKDPATGVGMIPSLKYKDCTLKPVAPQGNLHLAYGDKGGKPVMKWVVQECLVERSGKTAFDPVGVALESVDIKLAVKDGKLDVAE